MSGGLLVCEAVRGDDMVGGGLVQMSAFAHELLDASTELGFCQVAAVWAQERPDVGIVQQIRDQRVAAGFEVEADGMFMNQLAARLRGYGASAERNDMGCLSYEYFAERLGFEGAKCLLAVFFEYVGDAPAGH